MSRQSLHIHMPVYNTSPEFLREAVGAVHEDMEESGIDDFTLILLDDGSTRQDTVVAINELSENSRVKTWRNERNLGIGACRAALLNHSLEQGVFAVANRDSDDISVAGSARVELNMLESGYDLVGGAMLIRDMDGRESMRVPHTDQNSLITDIRRCLIPCFNPTVMLRTNRVPVGMNYASLRFGEDIHLQARLMAHGAMLGNTEDPVCTYRRNTGSLTHGYTNGPGAVLKHLSEARLLWSLSELGKPEPADLAFVCMRSVAKILPQRTHRFLSRAVYGNG